MSVVFPAKVDLPRPGRDLPDLISRNRRAAGSFHRAREILRANTAALALFMP
jgi:hypothetical protein